VNSHSRRVRRKRHLFCSISITPPTISGSQDKVALALGPEEELLIFRWFVLAHATCLGLGLALAFLVVSVTSYLIFRLETPLDYLLKLINPLTGPTHHSMIPIIR
jgi:hypothetical protein